MPTKKEFQDMFNLAKKFGIEITSFELRKPNYMADSGYERYGAHLKRAWYFPEYLKVKGERWTVSYSARENGEQFTMALQKNGNGFIRVKVFGTAKELRAVLQTTCWNTAYEAYEAFIKWGQENANEVSHE